MRETVTLTELVARGLELQRNGLHETAAELLAVAADLAEEQALGPGSRVRARLLRAAMRRSLAMLWLESQGIIVHNIQATIPPERHRGERLVFRVWPTHGPSFLLVHRRGRWRRMRDDNR